MSEKVYFIETTDNEGDSSRCEKLKNLMISNELLNFVEENDMIAVKTHFGEGSKSGYVRPLFLRMFGELVKDKKGLPFLTETSTLYKGKRTNAIIHIEHANSQGFGYDEVGYPLIMCDGLYGDEEHDVRIGGKIYDSVKIASLIVKAQGLIMLSHFTGHMIAGFGAALKNMGMGCSSRKGKMIQHSTAKPKIKTKACTGCEVCIKWCPVEAIRLNDEKALINPDICIGCGQCLAVCRFDSVQFNWGATYEDIQKKVVEHAWGVDKANEGKKLYANFLTKISKDCDCMDKYENICPDIGILVSTDPVAVDAASVDLVEERADKKISDLAFDIPYRYQIDYARELGFGSPDYELVKV